MSSNMEIVSPCKRQNSEKYDSSTSFSDIKLSTITLRTQKHKKGSKRNVLSMVDEEVASHTDSFLFPAELNVLHEESRLNTGKVAKNNNYVVNTNETVFQRHMDSKEIETFHENDDSSLKEKQQMFDNTDSCIKLKKHTKKKKHEYAESNIGLKNETEVSSSNSTQKEKIKKLKNKIRTKPEDVRLNKSDMEDSAFLSKIDSPVKKKKSKSSKKKFSLNQSYSDNVIENTVSGNIDIICCSKNSFNKSNQYTKYKKCKRKNSKESKINSFIENNVDDQKSGGKKNLTQFKNQELIEFSDNSSHLVPCNKIQFSVEMCNNLASTKKKKSDICMSNLQLGSSDFNQSVGKIYQKNKRQNSHEELLNTNCSSRKKLKKSTSLSSESNQFSITVKEAIICDKKESCKSKEVSRSENHDSAEMLSNLTTPKKKKSSTSINNQLLSCDFDQSKDFKYQENKTKNGPEEILNTAHISKKKLQKKIKGSLLEGNQFSISLNENLSNKMKSDINGEVSSTKNQDSAETLCNLASTQKKSCYTFVHNQPSSAEFNQSESKTYQVNDKQNNQKVMLNITCISEKTPKKKIKHSSLSESNQSENELPQNTSVSEQKPNTFEINNEEMRTNKQKLKKNKGGHCRAVHLLKTKVLGIEEKQKALLTEDFDVSSKSAESDVLNEIIHTKNSKMNLKPNAKLSVTNPRTMEKMKHKKTKANNTSSNESSYSLFIVNESNNSLKKNPNSALRKKNKDIKCKQHPIQSVQKNNPFDIDKIQQKLLAEAFKSINKSPKSNKLHKRLKTGKDKTYKELNTESNMKRNKKTSKVIHEGKKESNSAMQPKIDESISKEALSQPSTSQDVAFIGKAKTAKKSKTMIGFHETIKRRSPFKTAKLKSNLNQDEKLDIEKIQQKLIAAALKKVSSAQTKNKKSENSELKLDNNNIDSTKSKQVVKSGKSSKNLEFKEKTRTSSKKKTKSIIDPLEDFAAKLLSAELKKRKEGLKG